MGMNMKREWILWNALGSPENIVKDERMEEIERKGYYWAYRILDGAICASVVVLIWGSALGLEGFGETVPTGLLCHLLLSLLLFTELGRFLYSCYHGTQELLGRRGGMPAFLGAVIGAGIWAVWGVRGYWGIRDARLWAAFIFGALFFGLLCHLAYFYYAWAAGEEDEARVRKAGKRTVRICAFLLAAYGLFTSAGGARMFFEDARISNGKLTEEEKESAAAVLEGKERYEELESVKLECFYSEAGEDETAPYQNGGITHSYYWITPENLYSIVLDPVTGGIYREGYRDADRNWYAAEGDSWNEWDEFQSEAGFQPYIGILDMQTDAVEEIRTTHQDGETVYTVTYGPDYETIQERVGGESESSKAGALEVYTLNEFGVMTDYMLEEYEISEEGEKICAQRRAFTLLNADLTENGEEVRELIGQYEQI